MRSIKRLVKCPKLRINFDYYTEYDDAGNIIASSVCPYTSTHSPREFHPRCNGMNDRGVKCVYAESGTPQSQHIQ